MELAASSKGPHVLAELVNAESAWQARARDQEFAGHLGDMDGFNVITRVSLRRPPQPSLTA